MKTRLLFVLLLLGALVTGRAANFTVANADDSGVGSLRQALDDAAALSGADTITFDPAFFAIARTIALSTFSNPGAFGNTALALNDPDQVTIDASGVAGAVNISGGLQNFRLFYVPLGGRLALIGLTLKEGGGANFLRTGGAILNRGTLSLTRCTLSGNSPGEEGGAIFNAGTATLTHCTLSGNSTPLRGGAIFDSNQTALIHCTISGNTGSSGGGVNTEFGFVTLTNTLIAGNTATNGAGAGPDVLNANGTVTRQGVNLVQFLTNNGGTVNGPGTIIAAAPQLAALGSHGGPTPTMPPLPGSTAIDAGASTSETLDQRGFPRSVDAEGDGSARPDIGAVELQVRFVTTPEDENNGIGAGAGTSLREALADTSGQSDIVRFAAALDGQTLRLGLNGENSEIFINRDVTVDARDRTGGVTLSGDANNNGTHEDGDTRIFGVNANMTVFIQGLTLKDGYTTSYGGAIRNFGKLTLIRCTLSGNVANYGTSEGGAIGNGGYATLTQCTLFGNSADIGGAISNGDTMWLTHCTLSGNTARIGGGIMNKGASDLTLTNTIIGGNIITNIFGPTGYGVDIYNAGNSGTVTRVGANIVPVLDNYGSIDGSGTISSDDPKLAPTLASNRGSTETLALLGGSPARDAAVDSTIASDQRGFPLLGTADLGAYEAQFGVIADAATNEDPPFPVARMFNVGPVGTLSAASSNTTLVPNANILLSDSGTMRQVTVYPAQNAHGAATITLTDSLSGETQSFLVTVSSVNDAPVFTKGADQLVFIDSGPTTVPGWATGIAAGPADESTQTLTFYVTEISNPALFSSPPTVAANGTLTFTPAPGARGVATMRISLGDDGTPSAASVGAAFSIAVRLAQPQSTVVLAQGAGAPGRMTSAELPDDAVIVSFNTPATDNEGDLAFVAKWTSATAGKGTGLFFNDKCVAVIGGDASAITAVPGAKWKSFSDPVANGAASPSSRS